MSARQQGGRRPPVWPLTQSQLGLWFLDAVNPGSSFYVIAVGVRLLGDLDLPALRAALADVVQRQPALRTRFVSLNGRPYQTYASPPPPALPLTDLSGLPAEEAEQRVQSRCDELSAEPFDLRQDLLLRAELTRLGPGRHVLLLAVHHIIFDAWSLQVLLADLAEAYRARTAGQQPQPETLATTPGEYAIQQEQRFAEGSPERAEAATHWRTVLAGARPMDLPADFARPARRRFTGATSSRTLDEATTARVRQVAADLGVTPFHVLLTAFTLTMSRICGRRDVLVGVPLAGRAGPQLKNLVGFFVNALPLRVDLAGAGTFADAVARHWKPVMDLFSHEDFPLTLLVDDLQPARSGNRNPYFDVCFQVLPAPEGRLHFGDLAVETFGGARSTSQFDLSCDVHDLGNELRVVFEYSDELFSPSTIAAYQDLMAATLSQGVASPRGPLPAAPGGARHPADVPGPDRQAPLPAWQRTDGLPGLVAAQAVARPDDAAVRCGDQTLTYRELDRAASRVAADLTEAGVRPGDPVALLMEPSADVAAGMLGALRAGAVYVPVDPGAPRARVTSMLTRAGCDLMLAHEATARRGGGFGCRLVLVSAAATGEAAAPAPPRGAPDGSPAYMIFTSGSTGEPKAVLVSHGAAVHLARSAAQAYQLTPGDRVLQMASAAVDVSIEEYFGTWCAGGCAVTMTASEDLDAIIAAAELTVLNLPASRWQAWTQQLRTDGRAVPDSIRLVIAGSERVDPTAVRAWHEGPGARTRLLNAYGTTEATVTSAWYDTASLAGDAANTANVPIGFPFPGARLYVLDEDGTPATAGMPGELHIGGPGVALGYLGDPALTAARFVPDPFAAEPGARMYRTGDRVRQLPSGALDFLGRTDTQVKVRGSRINLLEVERTACEVPGVAEFAADVREGDDGVPRLIGYLRPADGAGDTRAAAARVEDWQAIHDDEAFNSAVPGGDQLVNTSGWISSYTHEPIPPDDMREWLDATADRLLREPPGRVLEIGCGTGMVLFQVAPHAESYVGTDISPAGLEHIRAHLGHAGLDSRRIQLIEAPAHDQSALDGQQFDLIIVNSVAQYFPDARYLRSVLREAWQRLRPGGRVFVGDVRDATTVRAFHLSVARQRDCGDLHPATLLETVTEAASMDSELCVAPSFFRALAAELAPAARAEIQVKQGRAATEMNRFRYDVVLTRPESQPRPPGKPEVLRRSGAVTEPDLERLLDGLGGRALLLTGVPDARCYPDALLAARMTAGLTQARFEDAARAILEELPALPHPDDIRDLAAARGLDAAITPVGQGRLAVAVGRPEQVRQMISGGQLSGEISLDDHPQATEPLRAAHRRGTLAAVREHLQRHLTPAMIPSRMMVVDEFPRTASGKVDRARLPDPPPLAAPAGQVPPRSPAEETLCATWAQVLGLDSVGVRDNFFEAGGDSISWLQIMSRCLRAGLRFNVRDIFDHQTIERLARCAEDRTAGVDQPDPAAVAPRAAGLTPIQHWFFEAFQDGRHQQNQAQWYELSARCAPGDLEAALAAVLEHHEALLYTFQAEAGAVRQRRGRVPDQLPLTTVRISGPASERADHMRRECDRAQSSLNIHHGPLLRLVLFRTPEGEPDLLFWCVHHLAVDVVSWQFLEEDLDAAVGARISGRPLHLPPATASVLQWAEWSSAEARRILPAELHTWQETGSAPAYQLPARYPGESPLAAAAHAEQRAITIPAAVALPGDEVFATCLSALRPALAAITGQDHGTVWLEYHGRPMRAEGPDVSRTVGWFTSLFPFLLAAEEEGPAIRRRLAQVPDGGINYGRARYLLGAPLATSANVVVNYNPPSPRAEHGAYLRPAPELAEHSGSTTASSAVIPFSAEFNFHLDHGGNLTVTAYLSARHFTAAAAAALADQLRSSLDTAFRRLADVSDQYPLTPMQRAMLYRHLMNPVNDLNYNDTVLTLAGPLDVTVLQAAWRLLTERHDLLRTTFRWEGRDEPVQVVHRTAARPIRVLHWEHLEETTAQTALADFLAGERAQPPALSGTPPIRLTLITRSQDRAWLVWLDHHILLDGWSTDILFRELTQLYTAAQPGQPSPAPMPSPVRFRDYVAWLGTQSTTAAREYWQSALGSFARPTPVPGNAPPPDSGAEDFESAEIRLEPHVRDGLLSAAHQARTTAGILFYTAWAVLLRQLSPAGPVTFGVALSGRPPSLGDVDSMVGLYMQTLPLTVPVSEGRTLLETASRVAEECWALNDVAGAASLWDIYSWSGIPVSRPLFESAVVVQNFSRAAREAEDGQLRMQVTGARTEAGFPLTVFADPEDGTVRLAWQRARLDAHGAQQVLSGYKAVLQRLASGGSDLVADVTVTLPEPGDAPASGRTPRSARRSDDEVTARVSAVWQEVLGTGDFDEDTALFDAGATSLSARQVHARLCEEFGATLLITDIFQYPTVAAMAAHLKGGPPGVGRRAARSGRLDRRRQALRSASRPARPVQDGPRPTGKEGEDQ